MKRTMWILLLFVVLILSSFLIITQYHWVFRKSVDGEILEVERVDTTAAIVGSTVPSRTFSFAVAIRKSDGEIVTASAEDRQWAVAKKGMCVKGTVDPYPPWDLEKAGTYYNARLLQLKDCATNTLAQPVAPATAQTPEATPAN